MANKGTFTKGDARAGRKKGVPNKATKELREMILAALDGAGGEAYLQQQARDNPPAFLALVGKTLPKDMKISSALDGEITIRFSNGKVQA